MQMKGLAGLNGWRWIFIIEGLMTVVLGIAGYWLLVDFPDATRQNWSFLGQREREWYVLISSTPLPTQYYLPKILTPQDLRPRQRRPRRRQTATLLPRQIPRRRHGHQNLGLRHDLLQHDHSHLRPRLLPPHHPLLQHGFRRRPIPMSRRAPLCLRRHHHVCHGLVRRPVPPAWGGDCV